MVKPPMGSVKERRKAAANEKRLAEMASSESATKKSRETKERPSAKKTKSMSRSTEKMQQPQQLKSSRSRLNFLKRKGGAASTPMAQAPSAKPKGFSSQSVTHSSSQSSNLPPQKGSKSSEKIDKHATKSGSASKLGSAKGKSNAQSSAMRTAQSVRGSKSKSSDGTTTTTTTTDTHVTSNTIQLPPPPPPDTSGVEDMPWFHGMLGKEDIAKLLVENGQFLARKLVECNPETGKWYVERTREYDTITKLVDVYMTTDRPLTGRSGCMLLKPVERQEWEIRHSQITLDKKLGEGEFGEVFSGTLKLDTGGVIKVAIKKHRNDGELDKQELAETLKEGRLMQKYRHENVIRFYGIACDRAPIMLVLELVDGGSLDKFLAKNKPPLISSQRLSLCVDASKGLEYLHGLQCVHRDMAARNCLINVDEFVVKISDFGLSREGGYYQMTTNRKVPIRWLAQETLSCGSYSIKTDVWSFGVLMWEIYSCGAEPYLGMTTGEVQKSVKGGYRLPPPDCMPDTVSVTMKKCWDVSPSNRPDMSAIRKELTEAMKSESGV